MSKKDPPIIPDVYIRTIEQLITKEHALDHVVPLWAASMLLQSKCCREKGKVPLLPELVRAARTFLAVQNPQTGEIPWRVIAGGKGLSRFPFLGSVFKDGGSFDKAFPASLFLLAALSNICQADPGMIDRDDALSEKVGKAVRELENRLDTTDTKAFGLGTPDELGQHAFGWMIPGAEGWTADGGQTTAPVAKTDQPPPCSLFNNLLAWQVFRSFAPSHCENLRSGIFNAVIKDDTRAIFIDPHPAGMALFLFTFPDAEPATTAFVQDLLSRRTVSFRLPLSDVMRAFYVIEAMKYLHWADTESFLRSVRLYVARFGTVPVVLHGAVEDKGFLNAAGSILIADIVDRH